ncbi:MAG: alternative ribosome rescue aminoacyl-tRNA hydrolase ArfB [Anaerolineales bacterium]
MIQITPSLALEDREVTLDFVRASGPGGQNVNKVATAVQLRFDAAHSPSLPDDVRARLLAQAAGQITTDGVLVIDARRHRTQARNREDALERLADLIRRAATPPKPRHPTRTPKAAKQKRLDSKRRLSERKRLRRDLPSD